MRDDEIARIARDCNGQSPRHTNFSEDQRVAFDYALDWLQYRNEQVLHIDGPAGCGKTELITQLRYSLNHLTVQYAAFTGKAASLL